MRIAVLVHATGGAMATRTIGFAVTSEDQPKLDGLVERIAGGNRSEFLRMAIRTMAVKDRADRLRSVQDRTRAALRRPYSSEEIASLTRRVLAEHRPDDAAAQP